MIEEGMKKFAPDVGARKHHSVEGGVRMAYPAIRTHTLHDESNISANIKT